ncbi:protein kinase [bacterium]|nr:protein kinase [bacterium]
MIGRTLGPYEITAKLGEGGMGEVYRARDTRLDRDVALKFLQPAFAADPERLARFRNEAKVLAALNHPNIAAIHGLEEADDLRFLVMEYVEGQDVTDRIDAAPVPLDEALELARQFAEGLEAAHDRGIIHRDLKPSNLRLTPDGQLKILDFGLARADDPLDSGDILNSPTMTVAYTREGVIMGTAAYMSPEQARGRKVDQRTDVWAFGAILYEMLSGRRLFHGETVSDTVAAVLRADLDLADLPGDTPNGVRRLLQRCLERDARRRLRHIGEARVRLERWRDDPATMHESVLGAPAPAAGRPSPLPWLVAGLAVVAAAWFGWSALGPRPAPPRAHTEWMLEVANEDDIPNTRKNVLVSPDGEYLAWVTRDGINVRARTRLESTLLPGTAGTEAACFSPDGRWIAFMGGGKIRRISVAGGTPFDLVDAPLTRGITWVDETTLVYTQGIAFGLTALDLRSGETSALTEPDSSRGERSHRWPQFVPGRRGVVFECQFLGRNYDQSAVEYVDLDTKERQVILRGGATPVVRTAGHLLFTRGTGIYAVGLDLATLTPTGLPQLVREDVSTSVGNQEDDDGSAQFAVDEQGNLLYLDLRGSRSEDVRLAWLDFATGDVTPFTDYRHYGYGNVSPDGGKLAIEVRDADYDITVRDLLTGREQQLTNRPSVEYVGAWSPDSRTFYWSQGADAGTNFEVWSRPVDGSLRPEPVISPPSLGGVWPDAVSPDGRHLAISIFSGANGFDITTLDLAADPKTLTPLVGGPSSQRDARFSTDGRYVFYVEGAQYFREDTANGGEILLRRFPDTGAVWSLPPTMGRLDAYIWSAARASIILIDQIGFFRIPVDFAGEAPDIGRPELLLDLRPHPDFPRIGQVILHPDGRRAIVGLEPEQNDKVAPSLVYVTGWDDLVRRKLAAAAD